MRDSDLDTQKAGPFTWLARLIVFLIVLGACLAAGLVLLLRWQDPGSGGIVGSGRGVSSLNFAERIFLQGYLASRSEDLERPAGDGNGEASFEISPGENAEQIAANLVEQGFLMDRSLFRNYIRYHGLDSRLEAGLFHLNRQLTIPELAAALTQSSAHEVELRFIEGWRLEQMAEYLAATEPANIDSAEFLAIVERRATLDLGAYDFLATLPAGATLEGFMFPDTYRLRTDANAADLAKAMLGNFDERVTPALRQSFGIQGLSTFEAVTLASIVQREAVLSDEQPLMVGVFLNRLSQGALLQADPTVQYALGYQSDSGKWWKAPLNLEDLEVTSPYNTYRVAGLPPGPIANPGLSALQAVAFPTMTDDFYFVLDCTAEQPGTHVFSQTFEEHLAHVERCSKP
jgi:UPF0755 protein